MQHEIEPGKSMVRKSTSIYTYTSQFAIVPPQKSPRPEKKFLQQLILHSPVEHHLRIPSTTVIMTMIPCLQEELCDRYWISSRYLERGLGIKF